jgi:NhaP-type Na+/H+ or K+/H+ antiporter
LEASKGVDDIGEFGTSYNMWMGIEPHLLLFTLLPPLLAGDAMTIDTTVAKRVAYQCLYLAGPGVLAQAFAVAGILKAFLGWSFFLCLTTGSILCATDPVAVVALLKELGASPVLTVQIQGESLLNDGTSIVLFLISYNVVSGVVYDEAEILDFFLKTALMAWALGMAIGYFFFFWILQLATNLSI